ncbi:MAG: dienelactone hydrolase family protein [Polyangiales bacterium]
MRALFATVLLLAACGHARDADRAHLAAMHRAHALDTPAANDAAAAPRVPVTAGDARYGEGDVAATGYFARPAGDERALPGLLVVHEWWGLNDNVRAMARRFAGEGYQVLAVDLYDARVATNADEARAAMGAVMARPARGVANLRAAAAFLRDARHAPRLGVVGWCFGGGGSLEAALTLPEAVDAAVMYYGRVVTDEARLARLDAPLLGHFGGADTGIPLDGVRAMEAALRGLGRDVTVHVYEGAGHAFANPSGPRYEPAAAALAWTRTAAFFARHLQGGS